MYCRRDVATANAMTGEESETPEERWTALLSAATCEAPVRAQTFVRGWQSFSRPVEVTCDDGTNRVVKGLRRDQALMPKALTTERAAGLLGQALGAPVPSVGLVDVGPLVQVEPRMGHLLPGLAHGSVRLPNCSDRRGIELGLFGNSATRR